MNSQTLTPFASELGSLLSKESARVAEPRKMSRKVLDKKLATIATATVKPVAGVNAGPAKIAAARSRASRKGDLSLLRRTTKEKTASMRKTSHMEKRAAAKHGLAQVLEKNAMIKEAAIQLMVKEAFMCELYRIAEETGDWRLRHSLAFQEEAIIEEFEKQAIVGLGRAIKGFASGWGKGWAKGTARHGAAQTRAAQAGTTKPGFFSGLGRKLQTAWGGGMRQMKGNWQAARQGAGLTPSGVRGTQATDKVLTGQKVIRNPQTGATGAGTRKSGTSGADAAAQRELRGRQIAARDAAKGRTAPSDATGKRYLGQDAGSIAKRRELREARRTSRIERSQTRAAYKAEATGGGTITVPAANRPLPANLRAPTGLSNKALRRWKASPEGKKVLAERAAFLKKNKGLTETAPSGVVLQTRAPNAANRLANQQLNAQGAGIMRGPGGGQMTRTPVGGGGVRQVKQAPAASPRAPGEAAKLEVQATKPKGQSIKEQNLATQQKQTGPAGNPEGAAPVVEGGAAPVAEGGGGFWNSPAFTSSSVQAPGWMPKAVHSKWSALSPEQRRLWALGGMAGAGGLTAGAIVG